MSVAAVGSVVVFGIAYIFIATEKIDKTVAALLGASVVIVLGFVPYHEALERIDLNVILLLIGMMLVMSMLSDTGVFEWLAVTIAKGAKGNGLVIYLAFLFVTAVLSAFLDNVTTVILLAPVTILIAEMLEIRPVPILILVAIASNIGGTSTLIGDPPNILIGSQAGLSFNEFIENLTPPVLVMAAMIFPVTAVVFRRQLHVRSDARERLARTQPDRAILDSKSLRNGGIIFVLMIVGFFVSRYMGIEPGIIAIGGAMAMSLVCGKDLHEALHRVEWNTVFFFVGLFMLIGSLEYNGIFESLGEFILTSTGGDLLQTVMIVLWVSAIASAIVDNIPLVIAMIPLIQSIIPTFAAALGNPDAEVVRQQIGEPLYWALALGACLGGNGTLVGASANVVISQIARRNNYQMSFMQFTYYGFPIMLVTLAISSVYLYWRYF